MTDPSHTRSEARREFERRRRRKSIAIAIGIVGLVVMFYFVTIVKMQNMPLQVQLP